MYDISIDYVYQTAPPGKAETVGSTGLPPPGPINFTDVTETSFVAHWKKPQFDAQPIGYHVTYTGPDGIPVSVDVDGPDTLSLEIDDAQPGSLYDFTVAADYGDMGLSEDVAAKVTTDEPICSCATYVRRQQQMEKTVGKLVDIIGDLQKKIDDLQNFLTIQSAKTCAIAPGRRDETTSDKLDATNP